MVSMFAFLRMSLAVRSQEVAFVGKCSLCLLGRGERGAGRAGVAGLREGTGDRKREGRRVLHGVLGRPGFRGKTPGRPPRDESRAEHQAARSHLETLPTRSLGAVGEPSSGVP